MLTAKLKEVEFHEICRKARDTAKHSSPVDTAYYYQVWLGVARAIGWDYPMMDHKPSDEMSEAFWLRQVAAALVAKYQAFPYDIVRPLAEHLFEGDVMYKHECLQISDHARAVSIVSQGEDWAMLVEGKLTLPVNFCPLCGVTLTMHSQVDNSVWSCQWLT